MAEGEIRLRYAGFIMFLSRLISVGTGLIFTLLVTRTISPEDYGVYGNLGDIISYFTIASAIIPFWVVRFEARRWQGSLKTGLIANLLMGLAFTAIYMLSILGIMRALNIDLIYLPAYSIAAIMILMGYVLSVLEASIYSRSPEKIGFGLLVFEFSKVVMGILLLYVFRMGLVGALVSIIVASACQTALYLWLLLKRFRERFVWAYVKEWLKASLLNIYGIAGERLLLFANILLFIYGGELSRAYYGASSTIASIVTYSSSLAFALYPKLLSGARSDDITLSLRLISMFAIPMFFGAIILSEDLLLILNPVYGVASSTLIVLALSSLIVSISSVFETVIIGTEDFDATAKVSFRRAFRSRLFLLLTLRYVQALIVLPATYIVLSLRSLDCVSATFYFALIGCVGNVIVTFAKLHMAMKSMSFTVPWGSLIKYTCSSLVMSLALLTFLTPPRLTMVLLRVLVGAATYFAALIAIDHEARGIARAAWKKALELLM